MGEESPKAASAPTGAVFLSYASEDVEAAARISAALRAAGIEVWFDRSELRGGDAWDRRIREQIHDCRLFIPVISANSERRDEGYFRREWRLAVERAGDMAEKKAFLVPVVIDGTGERGTSVPDKFRELQWTRALAGETPPAFVERVQRLLSPEATTMIRPATRGLSGAVTPKPLRAPWRSKPALLVVVVAAILVAIAYVVVDKFGPSKRIASSSTTGPTSARPQSPAALEKSIAVLPFADLSEKHDQEYFADGMAEEILDLLVKIPHLNVIGRSSSFQFKGLNEDLRALGAKLGVGYIVEGTVRRAGDKIRVTAQLIDTHTGADVWSDGYDRDLGDVLALQGQIAAAVARQLQIGVGADQPPSLRKLTSTEAYTHYLRGLSAYNRLNTEGTAEARSEFEQTLALDPSFVRAAEHLALTGVQAALNQVDFAAPEWRQAQEAAAQALRVDSDSAVAHAVLGVMHAEFEFDWAAADAELNKALASNVRDPVTLDFAARLAIHRGWRDEALRRIGASLALDPLNPYALETRGIIYYLSGDYPSAEGDVRKVTQISPTFFGAHCIVGNVLLARNQPEAALKEMDLETSPLCFLVGHALAFHALGRNAESDRALSELLRESVNTYPWWPTGVAMVYAYRGETDRAFEWLEKAYKIRDPDILLWARYDPMFVSLHQDPRFAALVRRMNLPNDR